MCVCARAKRAGECLSLLRTVLVCLFKYLLTDGIKEGNLNIVLYSHLYTLSIVIAFSFSRIFCSQLPLHVLCSHFAFFAPCFSPVEFTLVCYPCSLLLSPRLLACSRLWFIVSLVCLSLCIHFYSGTNHLLQVTCVNYLIISFLYYVLL